MRAQWRRVLGAGLLAGCTAGPDGAGGPPPQEWEAVADSLDARLSADTALAAVFLVARGGEVVFAKGYGLADREAGARWSPTTVSDIGSLVKGVTGAAVVRLAEEGKLSYDDPLTKYFEDVPADKRAVTLHQLLTHTAGFTGALGSDEDTVSRDSLVALALRSALRFEPGTAHRYSNVGYSLLAAVVEKASGLPYERYVQERLFAPAGVRETGYAAPEWQAERLAAGYRRDGTRWGTPLDQPWREDGPGWHLRGNGGMLSTAEEMHRWLEALRTDRVLSAEGRERLFGRHVEEAPGSGSFYGYGWVSGDTPHGPEVWHNGGNGFFFAEQFVYPERELVLVALTNREGRAFARAWSAVRKAALTGQAPTRAPVVLDARTLEAYTGVYRLPGGKRLTVTRSGEKLHAQLGGQPRVELDPESETRFAIHEADAEVEFVRDEAGRATAVRGRQGAMTFTAERAADTPAAPAELPDSPLGRRAAALLGVAAGGDEAAIRRYLQENFAPQFLNAFPMKAHLRQLRGLQASLARPELVGFEAVGPHEAMIRARSAATGATVTFHLELEPKPPHRVESLGWRRE